MSPTAVSINALAAAALIAAMVKSRKKTVMALKSAWKMFLSMLPMLIIIILLIGLLFGFVPEEDLKSFLGDQSGPVGVLVTAVVGALLHIPALLAFPLAASLIEKGASVTVAAAFLTTLTMIGMVTLPLEIKELGKKFALMRNGLSFIAALIISYLLGVFV
ncbi:MAG: permease [Spirochaetia bacterium]|nr:permease [Spirochaetia bacterium]MCF7953106.1 permease [Spirochaetales bacterium]